MGLGHMSDNDLANNINNPPVEMDMQMTSDVGLVLAQIHLDSRITRLRTAVNMVAKQKGWSDDRIEEVMETARNVIKQHQPAMLRILRGRHNELKRRYRRM